jgi:drug/metabolite transporter (DMT)-like permease
MSAYRLVGATLVTGVFAVTPFAGGVTLGGKLLALVLGLIGVVLLVRRPDNSSSNSDAGDPRDRFWARQSELSTGLEEQLGEFVASWLASAWPFRKVTLNGQLRDLNPPAAV